MQTRDNQKTLKNGGGTAGSGSTQKAEEVIAESGITFQLWRLYQHFWLICLFFPLASLVSKPDPLLRLALGSTALLFFAISYTWIMWPHPAASVRQACARSRLSMLLFGALCLQVTLFSLLDGPAWLWLLLGMSAIAGVVFPMRRAGVTVVLLTLLPLLIIIIAHQGVAGIDWWWLIALMLLVRGLGLDMIGVTRMGSAIRELHIARRELARLAVIEERERLARDLHDLLGQTLSVITLKSELARCLIEEDPERCEKELSEIEQLTRTTLREVRKTVVGYRQPTLVNELDGARQLLEAAGIQYMVEQTTPDLPQTLDAVLAWTVREGVTNVIRHSRTRQCLIRITPTRERVSAEVINDGDRQEDLHEDWLTRHMAQGNGLFGLHERVTALGGTMQAGPQGGLPQFRLRVELPMQAQMAATILQEEGR